MGVALLHALVFALAIGLFVFKTPEVAPEQFIDLNTIALPEPPTPAPPPQPENPPEPQKAQTPPQAPPQTPTTEQTTPSEAQEPNYVPQYSLTQVPVLPTSTILSRIIYPTLAAKLGLEATVILELYIDQTGKIRQIKVLKDPGNGFASAAVAALSGLTCQPAQINGQPVAVKFRYPIRFTLH